ncbi:MAG: bifunctional demethylmenaquinone methyltransferase/2-methoxy-6-polyprenyl-1,4-benzoquinol methylase UbiE [Bacteroidales bacterium]|nr:bifunctional demethylmenaquinone methyltransferase/2-methoxy-6-polyprenyl-1,4-benzoquinol methylase UbiE [Bacteroidales bacterium]MDD4602632.1 bifunctional demethylmenaquinone methyltransferase/2-methoxy-6-polyprenyl-1,4-benzoquinol methylase UbiE [Bacteroidales bacterium]
MDNNSKKEKVREMFDDISPKYDFLNHFLSFGIDYRWRKKLVSLLSMYHPRQILDVATGTGDLAIAMAALHPARIDGIDLSEKMLEIGLGKVRKKGLTSLISLHLADAENIPFPENSFDAITVAFGVRNFENLQKGLMEMKRVLRPKGIMLILEFSHPASFPMKQLYKIYSHYGIPIIGRFISKNQEAYTYLPHSVTAFPSGKEFLHILSSLELSGVRQYSLSAGIASIYIAEK